jgi:HEAT repeat protein
MQDASELSAAVFRFLTGPRFADKYKAIDLLDKQSRKIDFRLLRELLLKALEHDFSPGKEEAEADPSIGHTRMWLLSALGRISSGDDKTTNAIASHINKETEPNFWARYWALEGLIAGRNEKAYEIAKTAAQKEDDQLVSMLAVAYLASKQDPSALEKIKANLGNQQTQWHVLRALRVVPLPFTVDALCELVGRNEYTDETYDAIAALGRLPSSSPHVSRAAQALSAAVVEMRGTPWKDGMRTGAITALGNLKVESTGPLLLVELTDDNPAICREAADQRKRFLGLRRQ